jgi:hypothetical protein
MPRQLKVLDRTYEYQRRGLLHVHVVLGLATPAQRHAAMLYVAKLEELRSAWGFGFLDEKLSSIPGQRAAAYLSSYLVTGKGHKATVQETVLREDCPTMLVHISRELTQRTGITMRSLRRRRYEWVLARRDLGERISRATAIALLSASGYDSDHVRELVTARGP